MSYDNYFRRLNFSEVSNELDNFKAKEVSALTSDISSQLYIKSNFMILQSD